jgi:SRSO17 transposase
MEGLAKAAGHADRETPLKNYCAGLLLPGERKSVEPMVSGLPVGACCASNGGSAGTR